MNNHSQKQEKIKTKQEISHYSITFWVILQAGAIFLFATVAQYPYEITIPANAPNYYYSQPKSPVDMYYN